MIAQVAGAAPEPAAMFGMVKTTLPAVLPSTPSAPVQGAPLRLGAAGLILSGIVLMKVAT